MKKKNIGVYFFMIFQLLEIKKKKDEKKKIYAENRFGLLPKQYCGENILYFNRGDCIAGV